MSQWPTIRFGSCTRKVERWVWVLRGRFKVILRIFRNFHSLSLQLLTWLLNLSAGGLIETNCREKCKLVFHFQIKNKHTFKDMNLSQIMDFKILDTLIALFKMQNCTKLSICWIFRRCRKYVFELLINKYIHKYFLLKIVIVCKFFRSENWSF